jgi:glutathione S-transferase
MVLYEKQLPFTICLLDLQKFEHLTPAYLRLNPNGAPRWFIAGVP